MDWETLGDGRADDAGTPFSIPIDVRRQHLYVLGRTGSGKSTMLARLALADIARGDGGLVLDPHGDLVQDIVANCPEDQLHRIIYLDAAEREHPVPFNMFECGQNQNRDTVCSEVIGVFKRLYGESWGPLLEDLLRSLTLAMLDHQFLHRTRTDDGRPIPEAHRYNATLKEAHDFLFNQSLRREFYDYISNEMVLRYWTDFYDNLGRLRHGATVTWEQIRHSSSTTNKLRRFLLNPLIFDITANTHRQNTIDVRRVMDEKKFLLVNLSKGRLGEENSALLGSVLLSRLVVAALSRADITVRERQSHPFHVIVDEFQAFATDSFKLLLSEARKYGITATIAHQHREQLDAEMRGATLNCGSIICFRLTGADAEDVGREFDSTPAHRGWRFEQVMTGLGANPEDQNETTRQELEDLRRRELYLTAELQRLRLAEDLPATRALVETKQKELDEARASLEEWAPTLLNRITQSLDETHAAQQGDSPVDAGSAYFTRSETYARVPERSSYAETERQIANDLTQLPNYSALARLADGKRRSLVARPLPPVRDDREIRIQSALGTANQLYAIAPEQRRSVREAGLLRQLRRDDAALYEAELNEQPP